MDQPRRELGAGPAPARRSGTGPRPAAPAPTAPRPARLRSHPSPAASPTPAVPGAVAAAPAGRRALRRGRPRRPARRAGTRGTRQGAGRTAGPLQRFLRSFVDEDESYKSPLAAPSRAPEPPPHSHHVDARRPPTTDGRPSWPWPPAGIATGAYLPWLTGTIDGIHFQRTGFDMGRGWGFWVGAVALAVAALLSVQMRKMRWVAMAVAIALTGFVVRDLLDTYDTMQSMNLAPSVFAEIGTGLWIMVGSAAVAMIAGFRLGEDDKIV